MQITLTHNSELRLHKVDALHRIYGVSYPITGDNHHPSIGEEVEVAKHSGRRYTDRDAATALGKLTRNLHKFATTQGHEELTATINTMEEQETLF